MKQMISFIYSLFLLSCGSNKIIETKPNDIFSGPKGVKTRIVIPERNLNLKEEEISEKTKVNSVSSNFSNSEVIGEIMNYLASDKLQGRDTGSEGIAKAANFIEHIFTVNEVKPYFESYRDTINDFNESAYNIVGMIEGIDHELKEEFIILGAHYDHLGRIDSQDADDIFNGANDNASGTTIVLELARFFANTKINKRSIIFALFSAEEIGLLGSKHLAKKLRTSGLGLYMMLNFEMLGVPLQDRDYLMYLTGFNLSNLASVTNNYTNKNLVGFFPKAKELNLFYRSDNAPFHEEYNVPSHTFSTFDFTNFDHYHKVSDEVSKIDFHHMATIVNELIPVIIGITNSKEQEIKYN